MPREDEKTMSATPNLFAPIRVGAVELKNRIVMAPMTRNRAGEGLAPTEINATYYAQRASAGLLVTEATQVSPRGVGYPNTPGIHTDEQVAGWRRIICSTARFIVVVIASMPREGPAGVTGGLITRRQRPGPSSYMAMGSTTEPVRWAIMAAMGVVDARRSKKGHQTPWSPAC